MADARRDGGTRYGNASGYGWTPLEDLAPADAGTQ
jgi:hypothetical protein